MIGVTGYLCEDFFPDLGSQPFEFVPGLLREVSSMPGRPGGSVGNTGGALCRLKVPVRLGVLTGNDGIGEIQRTAMADFAPSGGCEFKTLDNESSAFSIVLSPLNQDRMFLVCRGVNDRMNADTFSDAFYQDLTILHFGYPSLSTGMGGNQGTETKKLFERCQKRGILTSLDLSLPSPGTVFYDYDWKAFFRNVLPLTDLFCPSIDELRFMTKDQTSSPEALADQALAMGCSAVLLKLGKDGLLLRVADWDDTEQKFLRFGKGKWRGVSVRLPSDAKGVINTTGAGDTAIAGFLAGVETGADAEGAARLAVQTAVSRITSIHGIYGIQPLAR